MKVFRQSVILVTLLTASAFAQLTVEQIVAQGAPGDINIQPPIAGPESCSTVFSSDSKGNPRLVAAVYTNGDFGHLRMLSVGTGSTVSVAADVSAPTYMLGGSFCRLELVNLNSDTGKDPFLANVLMLNLMPLSSHGEMTWFFAWNGTNFVNLGPTFVEGDIPPVTVFHSAGPEDLDHLSTQQIESVGYDGDEYAQDDGLAATPTVAVYRYTGTSFQREKTLTAIARFKRDSSKPAPVRTDVTPDNCGALFTKPTSLNTPLCYEFEVRNPGTLYKLTAVNGTAAGKNRVSSAHVLLNNVEVISPRDLNQNVDSVSKMVQITQRNTIYASLDGAPGGTLAITIEPVE